jgi:hypothetical protein
MAHSHACSHDVIEEFYLREKRSHLVGLSVKVGKRSRTSLEVYDKVLCGRERRCNVFQPRRRDYLCHSCGWQRH